MRKLLALLLVVATLAIPGCIFSSIKVGATGWPPGVSIEFQTRTELPASQPAPAPESQPSGP